MTLEEYIARNYDDSATWFVEECNRPWHVSRIANCIANKEYLMGKHKVLDREDSEYKGKILRTRKVIIQYAKTLMTFHDTLLLGKPVTVVSEDMDTAKEISDIYKVGGYDSVDYKILDSVNKYGDAYEYVYVEDGFIKSKVLNSGECYPVYTDTGDYVALIEKWTDAFSGITYYTVYYKDRVDYFDNMGGNGLVLNKSVTNVTGLPIHYHNTNDETPYFGTSVLNDIKPLLDELEDILSKMGDAIYVNSLNPMPVALGQRIESSIPADATGYVMNLDNGDFKIVSTQMDYNTIKLYLDNIKMMINDVACFPSALSGNTNIANVSQVSLQFLFELAINKSQENEKWLNEGFVERFKKFASVENRLGKQIGMATVEYNLSMPVATDEVTDNLVKLHNIGAISLDTVREKSEYVKDVVAETERVASEE